MSLATTSLASRYSSNNTSTTEPTNNSNNMTNIKSVEICVNLVLSSAGIKESYFAQLQQKNGTKNDMPKVLLRGRSCSWLRVNTGEGSVYGDFLPLYNTKNDQYGNSNAPVVIFHMEDGTSKILNTTEARHFWEDTVGLTDIDGSKLSVKFNLNKADYRWDMVRTGLKVGRFRSVRIQFNTANPQFRKEINSEYEKLVLHTDNAKVDLHPETVFPPASNLVFKMREDFFVKEEEVQKDELAFLSTSSKRREKRRSKAQSNAARISVADAQRAREAAAAKATASEAPATPVVETPAVKVETPVAPQVDMAALIKQAVAAAIAPLTQEISSLRDELKAKDAEIQALKTAQAQPVAAPAPAPVVEEVTPEPEVVEEEPTVEEAVEEDVEEAPARGSTVSEEAFFASNLFFNVNDEDDDE